MDQRSIRSELHQLNQIRLVLQRIRPNDPLQLEASASLRTRSGEGTSVRTLQSFGQLEELSIRFSGSRLESEFALNLPMLQSIHLEDFFRIDKL